MIDQSDPSDQSDQAAQSGQSGQAVKSEQEQAAEAEHANSVPSTQGEAAANTATASVSPLPAEPAVPVQPVESQAPVEPVESPDVASAPKSVIADWKEKSPSSPTPLITSNDADAAVIASSISTPVTHQSISPIVPVEIERVPLETALTNGWEITIKNILLVFAISTIFGLVYCAPHAVRYVIADIVSRNFFLNACLVIVMFLIPFMYHMGRIKVTIQLHRKEPFTSDVFVTVAERSLHYMLMLLCRSTAIIVGYLFFVVPGVILQIRLDYADYFILDKKMNAFKAMKESWRLTENSALMLLLFNITCYFVETVGWICLLVGSVPARWMTGIAKAEIFDRLCATAPLKADPVAAQTEVGATSSLN